MIQNRNLDLVAVNAWAALTVVAVGHTEYVALRLVLALPLLLLFTGHAVLRGVGPRANSRTEHAVYAIGLSLAAVLMGGFLLNGLGALTPVYTPVGNLTRLQAGPLGSRAAASQACAAVKSGAGTACFPVAP